MFNKLETRIKQASMSNGSLAKSLILILLFWAPLALSTVQRPDSIIIDGEERILVGIVTSEPLEQLLDRRPLAKYRLSWFRREFCTASWIGFRAIWKLQDDKLFLVSLISDPCGSNTTEVPLSMVFWPRRAPILASWFSGTLFVTGGESGRGVLIVGIRKGRVVHQEDY